MNKLDYLRQLKRKLCMDCGLSVTPYGNAWHIHGRGVDFVISELAYVQPGDLRPVYQAQR